MPKRNTETPDGSDMPERLIRALDEAPVVSDIFALLFWAGEGISGTQGAAVAGGAMMAQERMDMLRAMLKPHTAQ